MSEFKINNVAYVCVFVFVVKFSDDLTSVERAWASVMLVMLQ